MEPPKMHFLGGKAAFIAFCAENAEKINIYTQFLIIFKYIFM